MATKKQEPVVSVDYASRNVNDCAIIEAGISGANGGVAKLYKYGNPNSLEQKTLNSDPHDIQFSAVPEAEMHDSYYVQAEFGGNSDVRDVLDCQSVDPPDPPGLLTNPQSKATVVIRGENWPVGETVYLRFYGQKHGERFLTAIDEDITVTPTSEDRPGPSSTRRSYFEHPVDIGEVNYIRFVVFARNRGSEVVACNPKTRIIPQ